MKRWEKILFVWFVLVILAVFWYGMRMAIRGTSMKFGKEVKVTQSIDIGRVSRED